MAGEIKITIQAILNNGGYKSTFSNGQNSITQATVGAAQGIQAVGTSAENIDGGDVGTPGYLLLKNLDSANYVEVGIDNTGFVAMAKLAAGEEACLPVADSTTIQLKANTASCKVAYLLMER
jgi:hypothetical protein